MHSRFIPVLLLKDGGLYKTRRFRNETYLGDPVNTLKIFNDKQVDEVVLLDIGAARTGAAPDIRMLREIASECFMPLAYGGGINSVDQVREILAVGFEKVVVNSAAWTDPALVPSLTNRFGSSSIVGSIDVSRNWMGREKVYIRGGREPIPMSVLDWASQLEQRGVGELMINCIDRDGEMTGYNLELIHRVADAVSVPVIAVGGARNVDDLNTVISASGASAAAAGAMFVFQGKHRAVLISYPNSHDRV
ncbi:MAG: AglZ/HisF2 family acetamidino modification protein [Rhizobiaceae bacterium]|nr:AglZ/HisF2 family acetamidino modification protein [Rhizobiaceae bacterium]MCZ8352532.1 AglZ/HisF2 family acetamidino modification protein [Rhizobium sp.]